ncbi:MAG: hypothetical protein CHACPFDD_01952 [Phycisphaerae bacterium]|nr:hypothetical protein [Phycisphaerae bacterium]
MIARRRRRLRRYAAAAAGALLLAVIVGGSAGTCRPAGYERVAIDHIRLPQDRNDFVNLVDRIGDALHRGEAIDFELSEDQLNRWIAARDELSPEPAPVRIEGLRYPHVRITPEGVVLAATRETAGIPLVISATIQVRVEGDALVWGLRRVAIGRLPLPTASVAEQLLRPLMARGVATQRTSSGEIRTSNRFVWPNGRIDACVQALTIRPGVISVRLGGRR